MHLAVRGCSARQAFSAVPTSVAGLFTCDCDVRAIGAMSTRSLDARIAPPSSRDARVGVPSPGNLKLGWVGRKSRP